MTGSVRLAFALPVFIALTSDSARAQWDTISIDYTGASPYRCHHRNIVPQLVDNVVFSTTSAPNTFCTQTFGAPQAYYDGDTGETFILGQGGNGSFDLGDGIMLLKRGSTGFFDTNPAPNPSASSVLHFPQVGPGTLGNCSECPTQARANCSPASGTDVCNWTWNGGLGAGAGFAVTPVETPTGFKYFAAVVVGYFNKAQVGAPFDQANGDRAEEQNAAGVSCGKSVGGSSPPNDAQAWITWAVGDDPGAGDQPIRWRFVNRNGNGLTDNPTESLYLIARNDRQHSFWASVPGGCDTIDPLKPVADGAWGTRFKHIRMFFNKYDGHFYILMGWKNSSTLKQGTTWWRMRFDPHADYGLGAMDILSDGDPSPSGYSPVFQAANAGCSLIRACIPSTEGWSESATYPNKLQPNVGGDGAVDPFEVLTLYGEADAGIGYVPLYGGLFDSHVAGYFSSIGSYTFVKGLARTFPFFDTSASPPHVIDTTALFAAGGLTSEPCTVCTPTEIANGECPPPTTVKYDPLSISGSGVALVQKAASTEPFVSANGAPNLWGYVSTSRIDLGACGNHRSGLLPTHLTVSSSGGAFPAIKGVTPLSAAAAAGSTITIKGVGFQSGSTVKFGGATATVTSTSATTIQATKPALTAGSISAITVTKGTQTASLLDGFLNNFTDVAAGSTYHPNVVKVARAGISAGCGGGLFCVSGDVTRGQMAVFLLKGKYASFAYAPPAATGAVFGDVPAGHQFATWIEALADHGISAGCGGGNFCPSASVTRKEMAVFLLKSVYGSSYTPPSCQGDFADVTCPSTFAAWIEKAADDGIMPGGTAGGCAAGSFCPDANVLRGPMANQVAAAFLP